MKQFFRTLFAFFTGQKYVMVGEPAQGETKSITLGKRDENGFCKVIVDDEETDVKMLVFDSEQVKILQEVTNKIDEQDRIKNV